MLRDQQMACARDGQKLGNPLDDAKENRLDGFRHVVASASHDRRACVSARNMPDFAKLAHPRARVVEEPLPRRAFAPLRGMARELRRAAPALEVRTAEA